MSSALVKTSVVPLPSDRTTRTMSSSLAASLSATVGVCWASRIGSLHLVTAPVKIIERESRSTTSTSPIASSMTGKLYMGTTEPAT
eukprot:scaffold139291_cov53-Prasinocladus_malaysianus.AAC.1